jgi:hypothetical protein
MAMRWSFGSPDPVGRLSGTEELRRVDRSTRVASGTLSCPACDAPVAPGPSALAPAQPIACPYCSHVAAVRDFLSLASPTRPARVVVRVRARRRASV